MNNFTLSLVLGFTAAVANIFGGLLIVRRQWERRYLRYFVAVGAGFMLATALLEMIPEAQRLSGELALLMTLGGYLVVHFFEHTITAHFHFGEETHPEELSPRVGATAAIGMFIHNFFDGVAIGSGFVVSARLGALVFLAVFLHKIPDGFTVASVLMASGRTAAQAMMAAVVMGVGTLAGVAAMWGVEMWGLPQQVGYGLSLAAGATVYVAASDLMPEVNREPGVMMPVWVFVGVALLLALRGLSPV